MSRCTIDNYPLGRSLQFIDIILKVAKVHSSGLDLTCSIQKCRDSA